MEEVPPKEYHRQIPHDRQDDSAISLEETDIPLFEKCIISIHNLMIQKGQLPSLDPIRRAAEEVDGIFDAEVYNSYKVSEIPNFLQGKLPKYGERRVLAVQTVLCELGILDPQDLNISNLQSALKQGKITGVPEPAYQPKVDDIKPENALYKVGDFVRVVSTAKSGHVRAPVYLLGKKGKIVNIQGSYLNPEDVAHFKEKVLRLPLYLVEFALEEVWGDACPPKSRKDTVRVEFYEHWLVKFD